MQIKILKNSALLEYIFAFVSILNFFSIYYFIPIFADTINFIWQVLLIYLFYKSSKFIPLKLINKLLTFYFIFITVVGISLLFYYFQYNYSLKYIIVYLINPIMLVEMFVVVKKDIWIKLENIMIILAIISLIFWLLYVIGMHTNSNMNIVLGNNSVNVPSYFNIDFFPQIGSNFLGNNVARNSGIFNEPAYYAYPLCISLFIEMFLRHKRRRFTYRFLILCITILTTTSTSGIIVAILSITYYILITTKNLDFKYIILLLIPFVALLLKFIISNKKGNTTGMTSYTIRSNDVYSSFMAWKQHLFFGNGLKNKDAISQYMYNFRENNMGSSAGFLNILAYGGIWGSLFYIIPTFLSSICSKYIFGIAISSIILLFFVPVDTAYMYVMLLSYFISCYLLNQYNNNKKNIL